ncbi:MAG: hypothetical protein V7K47_07205 [Nostoc sp.]
MLSDFGVFRKSNKLLLCDFDILGKKTGKLISQSACLLINVSNSRTQNNHRFITTAILDILIFEIYNKGYQNPMAMPTPGYAYALLVINVNEAMSSDKPLCSYASKFFSALNI